MLHSPLDTAQIASHGASRSDQWLIFFSKVLNAAVIVSALIGSVFLYRAGWDTKYTVTALLAAILLSLLAEIGGLYLPSRGGALERQFSQIVFVWAQTVSVLLLLACAPKTSSRYSRITIGAWLVATPILLSSRRIVARTLFVRLVSRKSLKRNALVWEVDGWVKRAKDMVLSSVTFLIARAAKLAWPGSALSRTARLRRGWPQALCIRASRQTSLRGRSPGALSAPLRPAVPPLDRGPIPSCRQTAALFAA